MRTGKKVVLFGVIGLLVSLAIAGLASVAPNIFGWLTLPFWLLPAIANLGAHDVGWPLFLVSGSLCYGGVAFLIFQLRARRAQR